MTTEQALRTAAQKYFDSYGHGSSDGCCMLHHGSQDGTPERECYVCTCGYEELKKALASNHDKDELADIEEQLKILKMVDPYVEISIGKEEFLDVDYHAPLCLACQSEPHTESCELSNRIAKLEKRRDELIKAIKEMK